MSACGVNYKVCRLPNHREVAWGQAATRNKYQAPATSSRPSRKAHADPKSPEGSCFGAIRPEDSGRGKPYSSRHRRLAGLLQRDLPGSCPARCGAPEKRGLISVRDFAAQNPWPASQSPPGRLRTFSRRQRQLLESCESPRSDTPRRTIACGRGWRRSLRLLPASSRRAS